MTRPLALAAAALVTSYAIGALIAAATGVATLADAAAGGTKLSAPGFMLVLEALAVALLVRGRRAGAFILAPVSALSLAAIAFDGDFAHTSLGPGHVAWQVLELGLTLAVFALALATLTRTRRRPAVA
jgi:hypothetical protein